MAWYGWFYIEFGIISFPVSLTLGCYNKPLSKIQFARSQVYTTTSKTHLKLRRSRAQCQGTGKMDQDQRQNKFIKFMHLGYLVHAFCSQSFRAGLKKIKPSKKLIFAGFFNPGCTICSKTPLNKFSNFNSNSFLANVVR